MTQWATFVGITGVVLVLLLVLSHLTQSAFADGSDDAGGGEQANGKTGAEPLGDGRESESERFPDDGDSDRERGVGADRAAGPTAETGETATEDREPATTVAGDRDDVPAPASSAGSATDRADTRTQAGVDPESFSTGELLANVALSQGLFAVVLLGAVVYTGIPADALGIEYTRSYLEHGLILGIAFGLALYVANEVGAAAATHLGLDHDEQLRELLGPDSLQGWVVLLVVVLPIIAIFEELLFRAALIGVVSAGYGIDPWLLAVLSSVAFAVGHGMQGSVGIVVTGVLGFVLAAIFVVTGSLLVVIVAHYVINALEFVVHEGIGFDWAETLES